MHETSTYPACGRPVRQSPLAAVLTATSGQLHVPRIPFFHSLLCRWQYNFPLESFWLVSILPVASNYLYSQISKVGNLEIFGSSTGGPGWQIQEGLQWVTAPDVSQIIGCAMAAGVTVPGESFGIEFAGVQNNRGFMRGPIGSHRSDLSDCKILFNETNSSIIDSFIRPWTILAAHKGLFAYPENMSIKATIEVLEFRKAGSNVDPVCRKRITFFDALPHDADGEDLVRDEGNSVITRACSFAYNGYTISDGSDVT